MAKKVFKLIFVLFVFVLFLVFIPSFFLSRHENYSKSDSYNLIPISSKPYVFEIIDSSFLSTISLQLKNPEIKNNQAINVDVYSNDNVLVQNFVFYGSNVGDPSWVNLRINSPTPYSDYHIKIYGESEFIDPVYILANNDGFVDLKTTVYQGNLYNRLRYNFELLIERLQNMSQIHLLGYLFTIVLIILV